MATFTARSDGPSLQQTRKPRPSRSPRKANVSVETIKRLEKMNGPLVGAKAGTLDAIQVALEKAGVIFTPENGDGPGVKLKKEKGRK